MPVDAPETRTVIHLRTGSKICVLVAIALVALAVYFYLVPVSVRTDSGAVFECGSALHPASSHFQQNICGNITDVSLYRAVLSAAVGVLIVVVGTWFFGVDRTLEERLPRFDDEDVPAPRPRRRYDDDRDAQAMHDERPGRPRRAPRDGAERDRHRGRGGHDEFDDSYDDDSYDDEMYDDDGDESAPRPRRRSASGSTHTSTR